MPKIGFNDLQTTVAGMILNRAHIMQSVHRIEANTLTVPIGIEFNPKFDELIVIKNSIFLNRDEYSFDSLNQNILSTENNIWIASKQYPVEFNFIVIKSTLPNVNAKIDRSTFTITEPIKAVPINVKGFNKAVDTLIVVKNNTMVAHDEYQIVDGTIVAGGGVDDLWEASKAMPVKFEFLVLKYVHPGNALTINGYHLLDRSVTMDALSEDIRSLLSMVTIIANQNDFLKDAIVKYGNLELSEYVKNKFNDPKNEINKKIDKHNKELLATMNYYDQISNTFKAKNTEIIDTLSKLKLIDDINKGLAPDPGNSGEPGQEP